MAERGARTTLMFGGVSVEVSLTKTSAKPVEAKHETRRMIGDRPAEEVRAEAAAAWQAQQPIAEMRGSGAGVEVGGPLDTGLTWEASGGPLVGPHAELPEERVEQGIYLDDGTFVDLTDKLAEIDARTKIEGMEVVATISSSSVPRSRVRDSHWIGLADAKGGGAKVLALIWRALRTSMDAAVVRWTKRTNQALGIIVATGALDEAGRPPALVLLEIEWSQNMRAPGPRVTMPIHAVVTSDEQDAATALVNALRTSPAVLRELRDERTAKRGELLKAAREGRLDAYEAPPEPVKAEASDDITEALQKAAAGQR